jgi:nucleotide-binding universal stress UspA family protein
MKLLLAVDGSDYTKRMLGYLMAHEEWLVKGHTIELLTVVLALPPRAATMVGRQAIEEYYEDEAERVLAPIRKYLAQHKLEAKLVAHHGHPGDVIAQRATEGSFDLVVMGSHGYGAMAGLVMGSVATRVLSQCKVPVLLVR